MNPPFRRIAALCAATFLAVFSAAAVNAAHSRHHHRATRAHHPTKSEHAAAARAHALHAAAHARNVAAHRAHVALAAAHAQAAVARVNRAIDRATHYRDPLTSAYTAPLMPGENIARTALAYRGVAYRFGGQSIRSGIDCSALVQAVCAKWGVYLPRVAGAQFHHGTPVKPWELQAGDLVFFKGTYKRGLSHVGIFIGQGKFIHAAGVHKGVRVSSLSDAYYQHHWAGARRLDLSKLPKADAELPVIAADVIVDRPGESSDPTAHGTIDDQTGSPLTQFEEPKTGRQIQGETGSIDFNLNTP